MLDLSYKARSTTKKGKAMNASIPVEFLNTNPNSKATFRPGGDAAYVSYLLGGIINEIADERQGDQDFESYHRKVVDNVSAELEFSPALKAKFLNAGHRIVSKEIDRRTKATIREAKKAAKVAKKTQPEPVITVHPMGGHAYKLGRWTYPVAEISISDSDEI